jgi:hypothetical protein
MDIEQTIIDRLIQIALRMNNPYDLFVVADKYL